MTELSVIVPCLNERDNLQPLLAALETALPEIAYEVVFVDDDSTDGTTELALSLSQARSNVRLLHRIGRRGLSSAVVEGMLSCSSPYLVVIDGDLQHDERVIPDMLRLLREQNLDVVVGTRNAQGGSMGEFSRQRQALSQTGRKLSSFIMSATVSDPMSGFFMVDRRFLVGVARDLSATGFKILLDLLASAKRPVRLAEVPYTFKNRQHGESKLDLLVGLEFFQLILDKLFGDWLPVTFMLFILVGSAGVIFNFVLFKAFTLSGLSFGTAFAVSTVIVMTINFLLNNYITFRSRRLRGASLLLGLLLFYAVCSLGLFMNLQIAARLRTLGLDTSMAAFSGIVLASVWNYFVTSLFVWKVKRRRRARVSHWVPHAEHQPTA